MYVMEMCDMGSEGMSRCNVCQTDGAGIEEGRVCHVVLGWTCSDV